MSDFVKDVTLALQKQIEAYAPVVQTQSVGTVIEDGDGIARASGLGGVRAQELVQFANGVMGIAFNLEHDAVGIIIMGAYDRIEEGMLVRGTGRIASVPVGDALLGRVVNALGQPIDGKGAIATDQYRPVERIAPGVIERKDVQRPVQTGIKALDAMIPIGRGQRELIIGDRQTGKSALAIDTIINQKNQNLACIYVAIGQKKSQIARVLDTLEKHGALDYTIVVVASADDPAAMQYIAPYAGCAIGEEFMETGRDALVVYDDLSKHAWAYRQVSLLLRRPPGREAYPGDVFYLHSRLLERAAQLSDARGGGSLTALPIIETLLGDVSAYVPTNVISITDGQIYLEGDLFYAGIRPAVNVGISVSRVGGDAQTQAMKQVAGRLRSDMAAFRELAAFAAFGADLDQATRKQLDRGYRLTEILKQPQYQPLPLAHQVVLIYAGTRGWADAVPLEQMHEWERQLLRFFTSSYPEVLYAITENKRLTSELQVELEEALAAFLYARTHGEVSLADLKEHVERTWPDEKWKGLLTYLQAFYPTLSPEMAGKKELPPETEARLKEAVRRFSQASLKGLADRPELEKLLSEEIHSRRAGTQIGLLLLQVDRFEQAGAEGEALLLKLGEVFQQWVHDWGFGDTVYRYGAGQFVFFLRQSSLRVVERRAEELRQRVKALYPQGWPKPLAASLGGAVCPGHSPVCGEVLRAAELALGRATTAGGDKVGESVALAAS